MLKNIAIGMTLLAMLVLVRHAVAGQATQPASAPSTQPLRGTITGVEGIVAIRMNENDKWQPAKLNMIVGEGAEFRTGPRSAVRIEMPGNQTITLDRLGTVKFLEAVQSGSKIKTDVGMKYGRVRYDIEAAGLEYDSTIHSPGSTLAVRGTKVSLTNEGSFAPVATSLTGKARFTGANGRTTSFGGKAPAVVESGAGGAAFTALDQTYVDPRFPGARSPSEQEAILNRPVTGTFLSTAPPQNITPPPPSDLHSGSLIFNLVWTASDFQASTPDLDLFVLSPRGEALFPKNGPTKTPSGGQSPTDDRGGGQFGQELAFWSDAFPLGTYNYQVHHVSGDAAEFAVVVLRDGRVIQGPNVGTVDGSDNQASYSVNVQNGGENAALKKKIAIKHAGTTRKNPAIRRKK